MNLGIYRDFSSIWLSDGEWSWAGVDGANLSDASQGAHDRERDRSKKLPAIHGADNMDKTARTENSQSGHNWWWSYRAIIDAADTSSQT